MAHRFIITLLALQLTPYSNITGSVKMSPPPGGKIDLTITNFYPKKAVSIERDQSTLISYLTDIHGNFSTIIPKQSLGKYQISAPIDGKYHHFSFDLIGDVKIICKGKSFHCQKQAE